MGGRLKRAETVKRAFIIYRYVKGNEDLVEIIKRFFVEKGKRSRSAESWQVDVLDPILPSGSDMLQGLLQAIKRCDLAVIIGNELSNNVSFELGLIYALGKDSILLVPDDAILDFKRAFSDLVGMKYTAYDPQRLMKVPELLERELFLLNERLVARAGAKLTPEYLMTLGDELQVLGLRTEALERYRAALALEPDNPRYLVRAGQLYLDMYRLSEAEEVLRRAIALDPRYALAYEVLGQTLLDAGQYERAISDCFEKIIALDVASEATYFRISVALNELGKSDLAASYLSEAIRRGHGNPALYYDRAWSCVRHSRKCVKEEEERWIRDGIQSLGEAILREPVYRERAAKDQDFDSVRDRPDFPA
jgi:tetratricopeptide (TPR) repeat protein